MYVHVGEAYISIWQQKNSHRCQKSDMGGEGGVAMGSDVLGWASSPEPAEPSPFKPEPGRALTRACNGLGPGFRFQKPEPRALIH